MPGVSKIIKNRIKSVGNTRKITKAMELVAAAKMRKAINSSLSSRIYAQHAWELLKNLSTERNLKHPLLNEVKNNKTLLVVIASNKGLCGSYNVNVIREAENYINKRKNKTIDLIVVGRKAEVIAKRLNNKILASFIEFSDHLHADELSGLNKIIIEEFIANNYEKVVLIYTDFVSSIKYVPKVKPLLPIKEENLLEFIGAEEKTKKAIGPQPVIGFEPSQEAVLEQVLPRLTEVQIYQAILEANASEHSARMLAMKNASDNAKNMLDDLQLYYNQSRQAAITQEIAEISSGAEALS